MECNNDMTVEEAGDKENKSSQESTNNVPATTSQKKTNAQSCKEYREKIKKFGPIVKKPAKPRTEINKAYYERNKLSFESRAEYMKEYRRKKKLEERRLEREKMEEIKKVLQKGFSDSKRICDDIISKATTK